MRRQRGTTLIELVAVVGIMLVLTAILAPKMSQLIGKMRLRSSVDTYGYLLQQARMLAVRDNKYYTVIPGTAGGTSVSACIDLNWNGTCDQGEPEVELPQTVSFAPTGAPSTVPITCGTSGPGPCPAGVTGLNYFEQTQNVQPTFNQRGLPCINFAGGTTEPNYSIGDRCVSRDPAPLAGSNPIGFLYTFQYTGMLGVNYAAVAITPAGRVTTWLYGGTDANGNAIWVR